MIVKSAARILDLLEFLATRTRPARLIDVAGHLGIAKSSAFALLSTVVAKGYVTEADGGYALAAGLGRQGWVGGETARLQGLARPVLAALAERTGETTFLGVLTPALAVRYLDKAISPSPVRYDNDLAHARPAYCTSVGIVLLADRSDAEIDAYLDAVPLARLTPHTIVDRDGIRRMIDRARRDGCISTADGMVLGAEGAAAPVRNAAGRAVAALVAIGLTWRFHPNLHAHLHDVSTAARELSDSLAGRSAAADLPDGAHTERREGCSA